MIAPAHSEDPIPPWQRYGWVMGAVWLVFLAFPVAGALGSGESRARVATALVLFALFAGTYLHGLYALVGSGSGALLARRGLTHLATMLLLCAGIHACVGAPATGGGPYLVALAMFTLPLVCWTDAIPSAREVGVESTPLPSRSVPAPLTLVPAANV